MCLTSLFIVEQMIWSGHLYHVMLSLLTLYKVICASGMSKKCITAFFLLSGIWLLGLVLGMLLVRLHYSVDLFLSAMITLLIMTNDKLMDFGMECLYLN